jgi:hypothetical protein
MIRDWFDRCRPFPIKYAPFLAPAENESHDID